MTELVIWKPMTMVSTSGAAMVKPIGRQVRHICLAWDLAHEKIEGSWRRSKPFYGMTWCGDRLGGLPALGDFREAPHCKRCVGSQERARLDSKHARHADYWSTQTSILTATQVELIYRAELDWLSRNRDYSTVVRNARMQSVMGAIGIIEALPMSTDDNPRRLVDILDAPILDFDSPKWNKSGMIFDDPK